MRKLFLLFTFVLCSGLWTKISAQTLISGTITSKNRHVSGVDITLKDTYDGATSSGEGNFSFETSEVGEKVLVFTHSDYTTIEIPVLLEGKPIKLEAVFKESIAQIEPLVIGAGSMEVSDKKRSAILSTLDIYTTAGGDGQITSAFATLPGIQVVGNAEGLSVRGGHGSESKFYMDGNLVNNYFTSSLPGYGGWDRLNPSLFKGYSFVSGGYSAVYGQALSSVMALESIDMPERTSADFGVSPIFLNAGYQKVNDNKDFSYGLSASYFDFRLIKGVLKLNTELPRGPNGFSGNANLRRITKSGGVIKYYGSLDNNLFHTRVLSDSDTEIGEDMKLKSLSTFQSVSWRERWGKNTLTVGGSYSYNQNRFDFTLPSQNVQNLEMDQSTYGLNFKSVLERSIFKRSVLKAGFELLSNREDFSSSAFEGAFKVNDLTSAVFSEVDLSLGSHFSLRGGLRAENSTALERWNLAPRMGVAYRISPTTTTSVSYGIFYQNPELRFLGAANKLPFQRAEHLIYQLQRTSEGRTLRFEAYYKDYRDLLQTYEPSPFDIKALGGEGKGYAKGIELFYRDKKTFENFDYWISYSFLDSKRNALNYPQPLQPDFASRHSLSVVAKKFILDWKTGVNLSYTYASGRPYYHIESYEKRNVLLEKGTAKDFSSLNLSFNYLPSIGKKEAKAFSIFVLSINNILGTKNIYGYRFTPSGGKIASKPLYDTFLFIGWFISFGVDRTQDAINNNL